MEKKFGGPHISINNNKKVNISKKKSKKKLKGWVLGFMSPNYQSMITSIFFPDNYPMCIGYTLAG